MIDRALISPQPSPYDLAKIRNDFPILSQIIKGKKLTYLDSAASTQKPLQVIEAESQFYRMSYANIHRGVYQLSQKATDSFESVREKIRHFIKAPSAKEIIFTRNATESINLVASSYAETFLQAGDEVIITGLEHHANIVPWQFLRDKKGIILKIAPLNERGEIPLETFQALLSKRTKFVSIAHVSNVLGTILPVIEMTALAHEVGAKVLIDGSQAVVHQPVDIQAIDCDFYVFSSHKLYGPTGVGVLWGRYDLLDAMPPYQGGGDMIVSVSFEKSIFAPPPTKFEAGTPAIAQVIGLGAAIDYCQSIGMKAIEAHETALLTYATSKLQSFEGLRIIGQAQHKASVLSFVFDDVHPHDVAQILDSEGIAVRAGHHCAQPIMTRYGIPATTRASLGLYSSVEDIDNLVTALHRVEEIFKR
jgi:cysteine desulfurase/selenocysteine lyase